MNDLSVNGYIILWVGEFFSLSAFYRRGYRLVAPGHIEGIRAGLTCASFSDLAKDPTGSRQLD